MALPKLVKRKTVWTKIESSYGVDPVPTSDNAVTVEDFSFDINADVIERDNVTLADLSKCSHLVGKRSVTMKFSLGLRGSGTSGSPPDYGHLLRACSLLETVEAGVSVTYEPTSSNQESVTIYFNQDGVLHKAVGCVGTASIESEVGKPGQISFTFSGKLKEYPTDSALSISTSCSLAPPLLLGATFTYDSWTATISKFTLDLNNSITERLDITESSGIQGFFISDRKPTASFDPEMVSVATRNIWQNFLEMNSGALLLSYGSDSGNIITISAPNCVKLAAPYGNRNGIATHEIRVGLYRVSGNDEFSIVLT